MTHIKRPRLIRLPDGFPPTPGPMSTDEGAAWMDEQYQIFANDTKRIQASAFDDRRCEYEDEAKVSSYFLAVSIFQSSRVLAKEASERITVKGYKAVFGNFLDPLEQQETDPHVSTRSFDLVFPFRRATLVISVTTTPQERKDHTWRAEAEKAIRDYKHLTVWNGKAKKTVKFLGLFYSGETPEAAKRVANSKQEKLYPLGNIIACRDVVSHAKYMQNLMSEAN